MEEELNYSTVIFKKKGQTSKEENEDSTIYSTVKSENRTINIKPKNNESYSTVKSEKRTFDTEQTSSHSHRSRLLLVCLGILCVIILLSISVIIHLTLRMSEEKENSEAKLSNLTAENQQLIKERHNLTIEKTKLQKHVNNLNWTLGVILKFNTFPVNEYCPQKTCQSCKTGWIQFQNKCYLFYDQPAPWKTWTASQNYCKNQTADLVVINSLEEQIFASNNSKYYFDKNHGFWMGLNKTPDGTWRWLDGRNDTLMYWIPNNLSEPYALMLPNSNFTANWIPGDDMFQNKFICEADVLIKAP